MLSKIGRFHHLLAEFIVIVLMWFSLILNFQCYPSFIEVNAKTLFDCNGLRISASLGTTTYIK